MKRTRIEWAETSWNPATGCTKLSPACDHCYAEAMSRRLKGRYGYDADEPFRVTLRPERLVQPFVVPTPQVVFVCSMGDLFHKDVPDDFIAAVHGVMSMAGQHTYQLLTKRADRALEWYAKHALPDCQAAALVMAPGIAEANRLAAERLEAIGRVDRRRHAQDLRGRAINGTGRNKWPLPNVWLGATIEDQARVDVRLGHLMQCPAAVRFVSCEPLLGPVELQLIPDGRNCQICGDNGHQLMECGYIGAGSRGLDWIIAGGETGPGARATSPQWLRLLRNEAACRRVPFFFKRWGEWAPRNQIDAGTQRGVPDPRLDTFDKVSPSRFGRKRTGRKLDGATYDGRPEISR